MLVLQNLVSVRVRCYCCFKFARLIGTQSSLCVFSTACLCIHLLVHRTIFLHKKWSSTGLSGKILHGSKLQTPEQLISHVPSPHLSERSLAGSMHWFGYTRKSMGPSFRYSGIPSVLQAQAGKWNELYFEQAQRSSWFGQVQYTLYCQ